MPLRLAYELGRTAPAVHPEPTLRDFFARMKYCVRGLITARLTQEWFGLLNAAHLEELVREHPHILSKLQRPYLHRRLNSRGRLAVLRAHYRFVAGQSRVALMKRVYSLHGCVISNLPGQSVDALQLRLFYDCRYEKEGEMSLGLFHANGTTPLFALSFCVNRFEDDLPLEMFIGGLQGHITEEHKQLVIDLTRAMHGLRPKALLAFAVQRLAQLWSIRIRIANPG